jgi:hypothetical protein
MKTVWYTWTWSVGSLCLLVTLGFFDTNLIMISCGTHVLRLFITRILKNKQNILMYIESAVRYTWNTVNGGRNLNTLDSFMLSIVSHWDSSEELHFLREAPTSLAPLPRYVPLQPFDSSVDWPSRTNRMTFMWFLYVGLGQREILPTKTNNTWLTEKTNSEKNIFATVPFDFVRKSVESFVVQVAAVCATWWNYFQIWHEVVVCGL